MMLFTYKEKQKSLLFCLILFREFYNNWLEGGSLASRCSLRTPYLLLIYCFILFHFFFVSSFCFVLFLFFLQCYFRTRQLRSFRWLSSYSDGHLFCPKKVSFFGAHVDLSEFTPVFVMGLDGVGLRFCSEGVCLQDIFPR